MTPVLQTTLRRFWRNKMSKECPNKGISWALDNRDEIIELAIREARTIEHEKED